MVEHKKVVVTEGQDVDTFNRNAVMDLVIEGLGENLVRGWLNRDNQGPRGGVSSRLYGVVEVNGIMVPVAINIYSDVVIENEVKKKIGEDQRSDRIRAALEKEEVQPISAPSSEEVHEGFSREALTRFNMTSLEMMLDRAGVSLTGTERKDQLVDLAYQNNL